MYLLNLRGKVGSHHNSCSQKSVFDLQAIKDLLTTHRREGQDQIFKVALTGDALLNNPRLNKGMGFTLKEREEFDLVGRLPSAYNSLEDQCARAYDQVRPLLLPRTLRPSLLTSVKAPKSDEQPREEYIFAELEGSKLGLVLLPSRPPSQRSPTDHLYPNGMLFLALCHKATRIDRRKRICRRYVTHPSKSPSAHVSIQAEAISNYSHLFRKSEGLFLSYPFRERMEKDFLHFIKGKSFDLIVVSDSEAILGIGDQGVGVWLRSNTQNAARLTQF